LTPGALQIRIDPAEIPQGALQKVFPHVIQAWEETVGPQRTTAVRSHAIMDDYWNHSSADDGMYREALGLTR